MIPSDADGSDPGFAKPDETVDNNRDGTGMEPSSRIEDEARFTTFQGNTVKTDDGLEAEAESKGTGPAKESTTDSMDAGHGSSAQDEDQGTVESEPQAADGDESNANATETMEEPDEQTVHPDAEKDGTAGSEVSSSEVDDSESQGGAVGPVAEALSDASASSPRADKRAVVEGGAAPAGAERDETASGTVKAGKTRAPASTAHPDDLEPGDAPDSATSPAKRDEKGPIESDVGPCEAETDGVEGALVAAVSVGAAAADTAPAEAEEPEEAEGRDSLDAAKEGTTLSAEAGPVEEDEESPAESGTDPAEAEADGAASAVVAAVAGGEGESDTAPAEAEEPEAAGSGRSPDGLEEGETPSSQPGPTEGDEPGPVESDAGLAEAEAEGVASGAVVAAAAAGEAEGDAALHGVVEEEVGETDEPGDLTGEPTPAGVPETADGRGASLDIERRKRRRYLVALLLLLLLLVCVSITFWRYLREPAPLPELLPVPASLNYAPHYLFSVQGLDEPVGVALSPQSDRIYVTETGGERLVKVFDRDGRLQGSFSPPRTGPAERSPVYLAVDDSGRVFVTDRLQHAVFIYDREGSYLDTLLSPELTLSEYVSGQVAGLQPGAALAYNLFESIVYYQRAGGGEQTLPAPDSSDWAPLGIRIDSRGAMLLTDVYGEHHSVRLISGGALPFSFRQNDDLPGATFGSFEKSDGQLLFPNTAVVDSMDRVYVTDGNNGRISVWDRSGEFLFDFGRGAGQDALSLPRGAAMDARDRLHVVDSVDQNVKVYDVSGAEPRFLFAFGEWGFGDGQFNFPNDIALDSTGRLYIADRENNRVQVWSY
jgi:DNA-binding beta-propeller fold protein YncE